MTQDAKDIMMETADALLRVIGDDYFTVEEDTCFCTYPTLKQIFVGFDCVELEEGSEFIVDFRNRLGKEEFGNISPFMLALLHECGHCETWWKMTWRNLRRCRHIKREIERGRRPTAQYYTLADERMATNWAIYFIREHTELVEYFDKTFKKHLTTLTLDDIIKLQKGKENT